VPVISRDGAGAMASPADIAGKLIEQVCASVFVGELGAVVAAQGYPVHRTRPGTR